MTPASQAALRSWSVPPAATLAIVLTALVYLRGWWMLRRAGVPLLPFWRVAAFLSGLLVLWIALASPMDVLNGFVLTAHMLQHMLLMMVAPPLLLLGAPLIPLVRGLPIFAAREFAGPFLNWPVVKHVGQALTNPAVALVLMGMTMFSWHIPAPYELALRSSGWHQIEHACFLIISLIFWWPVVEPWPGRSPSPRWAVVPYLLVADLQNTALSAVLVFSDRILYPTYAAVPRLFGLSALQDQVAAGAIMWAVGSLAFVVPAAAVAIQCLSRKRPPATARVLPKRMPSPPEEFLEVPSLASALGHFVPRRLSTGAREAGWFVVLFAVTGVLLAVLSAAGSDNDDQVLRFTNTAGPFTAAVFASPGDFSTGRNTFSVLVQDRDTQEFLNDAIISLSARPAAALKASSAVQAGYGKSGNQLLQSAELDLPTAGDWLLNVVLRHSSRVGETSQPLHVVKSEAGLDFPWSYTALLVCAAGLSFTYFWRHRTHRVGPAQRHGAVAS